MLSGEKNSAKIEWEREQTAAKFPKTFKQASWLLRAHSLKWSLPFGTEQHGSQKER